MTLLLGLFLSVAATTVPTGAWGLLAWWCDRFEREPLRFLALAFFWGTCPAVALSLAIELLLDVPAAGLGSQLVTRAVPVAAVAPVVEEAAKAAGLLLVLGVARAEVDDLLDGLLYGAMVGFGFAMTENLLYYLGALGDGGWGRWGVTVFLRGLLFGLNHAVFTAFTGAGIGLSRPVASPSGRVILVIAGLVLAVGTHALHNLGAALASASAAAILISLANGLVGLFLVILMFGLALRQEAAWIRMELAEEVGEHLADAEYRVLQTARGRLSMLAAARQAGGAKAIRATRRFQEAATELAFRKHRLGRRPGDAALAEEVARVRERLAQSRSALAA